MKTCREMMVNISFPWITMSYQSNFSFRWATARKNKKDAEDIIHVTWPRKTSFALMMNFSLYFLNVNMDIFKCILWQKERLYCIPHAQPLSLKWSRGDLTDTKENFLMVKGIKHWNRFVAAVKPPLLFSAFLLGRI